MLCIVDLDGTICSIQDRLKIAGPEPDRTDKAKLQKWLDLLQDEDALAQDRPISGILATVFALKQMGGHNLVFLTGRSDNYKAVTQRWLNRYRLTNIPLYMRQPNDWRPADQYKKEQILKIMGIYKPEVVLAIDDDPEGKTEKVYNDLGITFLKAFESTNKLTKEY
jgi:hypothetical protein